MAFRGLTCEPGDWGRRGDVGGWDVPSAGGFVASGVASAEGASEGSGGASGAEGPSEGSGGAGGADGAGASVVATLGAGAWGSSMIVASP